MSLRHLARTVLDLAGLPGAKQFGGQSFAGLLDPPRRRIASSGSERKRDRVIRSGGFSVASEPGGRAVGSLLDMGVAVSEVSYVNALPAWFPVSKGGMKSVIMDSVHYIVDGEGEEELYDLASDPGETVNLASDPRHHQEVDRLRGVLSQALRGSR